MAENQEIIEARENTHNREYYLNKVNENPCLIEWADEKIRDDKEIVLKAVSVDGGAL